MTPGRTKGDDLYSYQANVCYNLLSACKNINVR